MSSEKILKEESKLLPAIQFKEKENLEDLDLIFTKVSQTSWYPIFLNSISAGLSWGAGGMLVFMGNILAASPDRILCNDETFQNSTFDICADKCAGNITYEFENNWTSETIVTRFGLFCEKETIVNDMNTLNLTGMLVGGILFGNLSDIFGRRFIMVLTAFLAGLVGLATALLSSYSLYAFAIGRFFISCLIHGSNISQFVYGMEQSSPLNRARLGILTQIYFSLGYMTLSLVGWLFDDWKQMTLALSLFPMTMVFCISALPESYRWYFGQQRQEEGMKGIKAYSKKCGTILHDDFINNIVLRYDQSHEEACEGKTYSLRDLYRSKYLWRITLKMMVVFFVTNAVYYALFLIKLPGGLLVNNLIVGSMEFCAMFPTAAIINKKWCDRSRVTGAIFTSLAVAMFGCGVCVHLSTHKDDIPSKLMWFLSLMGCALVAAVYIIIYVWSCELYPTVIRNCSLGLLSTIGRSGAVIAPQIMKLAVFGFPWLPYVIFGIGCVFAASCSLTTPNTDGKKLMQSIDQAERHIQNS